MEPFKMKKKREEKKKNRNSNDWHSDFLDFFVDILFIFGDVLIWPLRLLWFILEFLFEIIGELFSGW